MPIKMPIMSSCCLVVVQWPINWAIDQSNNNNLWERCAQNSTDEAAHSFPHWDRKNLSSIKLSNRLIGRPQVCPIGSSQGVSRKFVVVVFWFNLCVQFTMAQLASQVLFSCPSSISNPFDSDKLFLFFSFKKPNWTLFDLWLSKAKPNSKGLELGCFWDPQLPVPLRPHVLFAASTRDGQWPGPHLPYWSQSHFLSEIGFNIETHRQTSTQED